VFARQTLIANTANTCMHVMKPLSPMHFFYASPQKTLAEAMKHRQTACCSFSSRDLSVVVVALPVPQFVISLD
jgi:hypothetical protein